MTDEDLVEPTADFWQNLLAIRRGESEQQEQETAFGRGKRARSVIGKYNDGLKSSDSVEEEYVSRIPFHPQTDRFLLLVLTKWTSMVTPA